MPFLDSSRFWLDLAQVVLAAGGLVWCLHLAETLPRSPEQRGLLHALLRFWGMAALVLGAVGFAVGSGLLAPWLLVASAMVFAAVAAPVLYLARRRYRDLEPRAAA